MFQFLFKYPSPVFSKGEFVLLGGWPKWILACLLLAAIAGLGLLIRSRLPRAAPSLRSWRAGVIWLLQSFLVAVLLILLWRPAMIVAELKPQQNIVAVVVDDSRSMALSEGRATRQAQAVKALQNGVLASLRKNFQTRLYRLDSHVSRISSLEELKPQAPATRIGDSLRQLVDETGDLPIGAVVLLSDGSDNASGVDRQTIAALRDRHIPVHTIGFGREQTPDDVEIENAIVAPRALAGSRLAATVSFQQRGYAGQKAMLKVRDGDNVLAGREVTLGGDGAIQTETVLFNAGEAGAHVFQFSIDPLPAEENIANNGVYRLVKVESDKRRILYVEGEPRWEYKFIRRAQEDDGIVELASMLRTTENKIYRQGIEDPTELAEGFPSRAEDLFRYQGLIIGSVEASYFTPAQQDLIKQFVDRRGGGLLLLGGRFALGDGGWSASSLADLLPVVLPGKKGTFHRDPATVELTPAGADSIICRLVEDPAGNLARWKKLPYLMNYQEAGTPKPGAVVLADMNAGGRKMPLLITENYGRGRTAVLATAGTWRWRMDLPLQDHSHETFWRQLLRWLVSGTPGHVVASVPSSMLLDDGRIRLSADVRDKDYLPAPDAHVEARITGPQGIAGQIELNPDASMPGTFRADWTAEKPGSYSAEFVAKRGDEELGTDTLAFQRIDGVAENFHTEQNRELLEKLSAETGGRYWRPGELSKLAGEIPYSEAGITVRETKDLWNMPAVFLLLLLLRSSEWLLRRKWGVV
jgi:uncharacterized membrane protein